MHLQRDCADPLYSLALGIKMNILLFLPGLLVLLFQYRGLVGTLESLAIIFLVQVALPAPFFLSIPGLDGGKAGDVDLTKAYLSRAFEFSRQFLYEWTVNWRFVSEETFLSARWARSLLLVHVALLVAFGLLRWSPFPGGTLGVLRRGLAPSNWTRPPVHPDQIPASRESGGVSWLTGRYPACAVQRQPDRHGMRSVAALPVPYMVLPATPIPPVVRRSVRDDLFRVRRDPAYEHGGEPPADPGYSTVLWAIIELAWSTAPATPTSSRLLLIGHALMIAGLWLCDPPAPRTSSPIKTE